VRWRNAANQELEKLGLNKIPFEEINLYSQNHLLRNLQRLRFAEKYADFIFSRLNQSQIQLRPYYCWNMMVEPDNYKHNEEQRKLNPVIVHAPTSKAIKGTTYVLKAFEQLKKDGIIFTPVLVENTPHIEALKIYENADIVLDQLILPGGGKLASEALAMGKVVISAMGYGSFPYKNAEDCPIVDADINSIYSVLKELILDHKKRSDIAKKGRTFSEKYFKPKYFCDSIISLIANENSLPADYDPVFFRNDFLPEKENIEIFNKWTSFVKNEDWYKKYVSSGERAGLHF
jgi:glycosyltransferase involved in cell wall biosynthesis